MIDKDEVIRDTSIFIQEDNNGAKYKHFITGVNVEFEAKIPYEAYTKMASPERIKFDSEQPLILTKKTFDVIYGEINIELQSIKNWLGNTEQHQEVLNAINKLIDKVSLRKIC